MYCTRGNQTWKHPGDLFAYATSKISKDNRIVKKGSQKGVAKEEGNAEVQ